jgi:tetratricopeptide (TPR) repeat protein
MKTKFMMVGLLAAGSLLMGQKVKSPKEGEAVQAVLNATTPDQKIAAVDSLLSKYKDTEFKAITLEMAGEAYQQKGDAANAIVYGNRALEADPKNFQAMLLVSGQLAQITKEFDLDKDEKVKRATKLANDAIATVNQTPKPNPKLSDEQWTGIKKDLVAQAHETLGVIAGIDKHWDASVTEFKMAVDDAANPETTTMVRLTAAYNNAKKYDEATAMADRVLAMPGTPDNLKKIATDEKARAAKAKAQK